MGMGMGIMGKMGILTRMGMGMGMGMGILKEWEWEWEWEWENENTHSKYPFFLLFDPNCDYDF